MKSLAFGEILWDIINGEAHLGGAPLNLSAHMSKMGFDSYIISAVGDDEYGKNALAKLSGMRVKADYISMLKQFPTGTVDVTLCDDGLPEYVINENTAWDNISVCDKVIKEISNRKWDVFCFGSLAQRTENNRILLKKLFESIDAEHVFYDVNLRQEYFSFDIIDFSFKKSDIVKINDDEAKVLSEMIFTKDLDEKSFAEALAEKYDLNLVCITRGGDGAAIFHDGVFLEIKGRKVKVADTVGAGDSFSAGLLVMYLNGKSPKDSAEFANRIGGFVASSYGAIPDYSDELKNEINELRK